VTTVLSAGDFDRIDRRLSDTDELLETAYPGDRGHRQPVHTVYVPADRYTADLPARWGADALAAVHAAGGMAALAGRVGIHPTLAEEVAVRVTAKLRSEPIEDLRIDFEDGYGDHGDAEDADAVRAARLVATGGTPRFIGIRFKCLEKPTRARALRTLDIFIGTLVDEDGLPDGLRLTLPKVSTVAQVEAMADVAAALEHAHGLPEGRLRFEVQVETPQLILGADGRSPLAQLPLAAKGRISAFHYGTYDYSAALGIPPGHQSMEHPAADHAKLVMQLAAAGTGIELSDGSTNILPIGDSTEAAWMLHARFVRRSLERGFPQGWDLHAHQLPTRFIATYAFYREGWPEAARRLRAYTEKKTGAVLDEPATARALAWFVTRGVQCGAIGGDEVADRIGLDEEELRELAHPKLRKG